MYTLIEYVSFSGAVSNGPSVDYQLCKSIIEAVVKTVYTDKPRDLHKQKIVAFSYFYDRAQDAGLVGMLKFFRL